MKTESKATRVWRDQNFEALTREQLQATQVSLQLVLDIWHSLELTDCTDINALIANPQKVYSDAVNKLAEVPKQTGRFPVSKAAYIQTLEVPLPDLLYRAAKAARQTPFGLSAELWHIVDGIVQIEENEAAALIDSQSIYVADPDKKKLLEDLQTWIELYNSLDARLKGELFSPLPAATQLFMGKFSYTQKSYPGPFTLALLPDKLREWLSL
jgi:hypothetical protein